VILIKLSLYFLDNASIAKAASATSIADLSPGDCFATKFNIAESSCALSRLTVFVFVAGSKLELVMDPRLNEFAPDMDLNLSK
jgi:hypothetical protein